MRSDANQGISMGPLLTNALCSMQSPLQGHFATFLSRYGIYFITSLKLGLTTKFVFNQWSLNKNMGVEI